MRHTLIRSYLVLGLIIAIETILLVRLHQPAPEVAQHAGLQHDEGPKGFVGDPAVALATLLLAAFTFGLYWATRSLGTATQDLVRGADRNAEMQLRAYLLLEDSRVEHVQGKFADTAIVSFKNFGQTPAHRVAVHIRGAYCPVPSAAVLPPELSAYKYKITTPVLSGPGMKSEVTCDVRNDLVPNGTHDLEIFVQGTIAYEDAFAKQRRTDFCLRLTEDENGERLVPWTVGNDAT